MKLSFIALILLSLFFISSFITAPFSRIDEEEKTEFYEISGSDTQALKEQMAELGPNGFHAYTRWYVNVSWRCRVSLETTFTMPKFTDVHQADPDLAVRWNSYYQKLVVHERSHQHHGRMASREVLANRCLGARAIIKKWALQDELFDKRTRHGIWEGVVLY